ncbi:MAG: hypothetical protein QW146_07570 [Candidatus Bathyarchaeia archaeon]
MGIYYPYDVPPWKYFFYEQGTGATPTHRLSMITRTSMIILWTTTVLCSSGHVIRETRQENNFQSVEWHIAGPSNRT